MSPSVASRKTGPTQEKKARGDCRVGRAFAEESDMAKGQMRKTKEARKPKATKPAGGSKTASVTDVFAKASDDATHHAGKKKSAA